MTFIDRMFPLSGFNRMLHLGYIRTQSHPRYPRYRIANYTEKAVFDKEWNDVTLQCRGLIFDDNTGAVIARPFRKFFNHNESSAPKIGLHDPVVVTDKMDGSLGILYRQPDGCWAVATRGSFDSDQARHATAVFQARYENYMGAAWGFNPPPGITYLFEIVYPANRIVVDYGQLDDLVLLGAVDDATGKSITPEVIQKSSNPWPGPVTETFTYNTFSQALGADPRPGKEGFVVLDLRTDERIKIKYEDYIKLHRIVTNLTARRVHEVMMQGLDLDTWISALPDEFHDWVLDVERQITQRVKGAKASIERQWHQVVGECEAASPEQDGWPTAVSMGLDTGRLLSRDQRRLFASHASKQPDAWALFAKLDGRPYEEELLKRADPGVETPQGRIFTEATS